MANLGIVGWWQNQFDIINNAWPQRRCKGADSVSKKKAPKEVQVRYCVLMWLSMWCSQPWFDFAKLGGLWLPFWCPTVWWLNWDAQNQRCTGWTIVAQQFFCFAVCMHKHWLMLNLLKVCGSIFDAPVGGSTGRSIQQAACFLTLLVQQSSPTRWSVAEAACIDIVKIWSVHADGVLPQDRVWWSLCADWSARFKRVHCIAFKLHGSAFVKFAIFTFAIYFYLLVWGFKTRKLFNIALTFAKLLFIV